MNILSHLATGSALALALDNPAAAVPLAITSHFVCDTIPHFGFRGEEGYREAFRHKMSYVMLAIDIIGSLSLMYLLRGQGFWVFAAALAALSPDLMWLIRYVFYERKNRAPPNWKIAKFHQKIQWCERQWGIVPELLFAAGMLYVVSRLA